MLMTTSDRFREPCEIKAGIELGIFNDSFDSQTVNLVQMRIKEKGTGIGSLLHSRTLKYTSTAGA